MKAARDFDHDREHRLAALRERLEVEGGRRRQRRRADFRERGGGRCAGRVCAVVVVAVGVAGASRVQARREQLRDHATGDDDDTGRLG